MRCSGVSVAQKVHVDAFVRRVAWVHIIITLLRCTAVHHSVFNEQSVSIERSMESDRFGSTTDR